MLIEVIGCIAWIPVRGSPIVEPTVVHFGRRISNINHHMMARFLDLMANLRIEFFVENWQMFMTTNTMII